jgi:Tfp pilus assembly protein PilN
VVHVGIVPRQVIDPWIQLFRAAGLALAGASLSSLSWAHGMASLWDKNRPSMILASEQGHVEGALIRNHRIYATSMEGEDTAELARACVSQLIRAGRLESPEHLRVIAHGAHAADMELETAQLPVSGNGSGENTFGAISTALLGLSRSGFRLNLIPAELRYQRNRLQFVPTYVLVGLLILVGASAWLREPYQESLYAAQLDQEAKRLSVEVRSVADQEAQLNRTADRLKALNALIANRDGNLEALRELSRLLPAGTFVTSYSYQDKVMAITGYSDSASAVQKALEGSSIFFDAQFTSSIIRDASGKDRFSLRASVR